MDYTIIGASLAFAVMAVIAFVCAPFAYGHSLDEGRRIQGWALHIVFNMVGIVFLGLSVMIFIDGAVL